LQKNDRQFSVILFCFILFYCEWSNRLMDCVTTAEYIVKLFPPSMQ